jgi:hypothetical protein
LTLVEIFDLFSCRLVGFSMQTDMCRNFVIDALKMAGFQFRSQTEAQPIRILSVSAQGRPVQEQAAFLVELVLNGARDHQLVVRDRPPLTQVVLLDQLQLPEREFHLCLLTLLTLTTKSVSGKNTSPSRHHVNSSTTCPMLNTRPRK